MKLDWDVFQPPSDQFNRLVSLMAKLHKLMGDCTPDQAYRYVPVLLVNGFTGEQGQYSQTLTTAWHTPPEKRTNDQTICCLEYMANKYIHINTSGYEDMYRTWYRDMIDILPSAYEEVPTFGWDEAA